MRLQTRDLTGRNLNTSPQLPLALRLRAESRLDAYVGSPDVLAWLAAMARGEGGVAVLTGPKGSGKTHLAMAVVQEAESLGRGAIYLPVAQLKGRLAAALADMDGLDLVVLDDLDAVLGDREDEVALFHFHNRARAHEVAVLYTLSQGVAALPPGLPDLRSRLAQCTQLQLPRPDDALRAAVLQRKAQLRGLALDDAVVAYLLRRVERDMADLTALLDRIDRASLAEQRRVTVPFLRALLDTEPPAT